MLMFMKIDIAEVKDFFPKAFHLTLFRGNRQNEAELKLN